MKVVVTENSLVPVTFVVASDFKKVTFAPTGFNEVGAHTILIDLLDDGQNILRKSFTVTVTNSAPHFTVSSFADLMSPLKSVTSRKITEMIDDE